jgi:hypothetical protein
MPSFPADRQRPDPVELFGGPDAGETCIAPENEQIAKDWPRSGAAGGSGPSRARQLRPHIPSECNAILRSFSDSKHSR